MENRSLWRRAIGLGLVLGVLAGACSSNDPDQSADEPETTTSSTGVDAGGGSGDGDAVTEPAPPPQASSVILAEGTNEDTGTREIRLVRDVDAWADGTPTVPVEPLATLDSDRPAGAYITGIEDRVAGGHAQLVETEAGTIIFVGTGHDREDPEAESSWDQALYVGTPEAGFEPTTTIPREYQGAGYLATSNGNGAVYGSMDGGCWRADPEGFSMILEDSAARMGCVFHPGGWVTMNTGSGTVEVTDLDRSSVTSVPVSAIGDDSPHWVSRDGSLLLVSALVGTGMQLTAIDIATGAVVAATSDDGDGTWAVDDLGDDGFLVHSSNPTQVVVFDRAGRRDIPLPGEGALSGGFLLDDGRAVLGYYSTTAGIAGIGVAEVASGNLDVLVEIDYDPTLAPGSPNGSLAAVGRTDPHIAALVGETVFVGSLDELIDTGLRAEQRSDFSVVGVAATKDLVLLVEDESGDWSVTFSPGDDPTAMSDAIEFDEEPSVTGWVDRTAVIVGRSDVGDSVALAGSDGAEIVADEDLLAGRPIGSDGERHLGAIAAGDGRLFIGTSLEPRFDIPYPLHICWLPVCEPSPVDDNAAVFRVRDASRPAGTAVVLN